MKFKVGEHFIVGFRGMTLPSWLKEFSTKYGLGGVILFDYDVQTKIYHNNIESASQVTALTSELHALPSHPLVFIDQEGGKVRRLKETSGFAPLPSQESLAKLSPAERLSLLIRSYEEMKQLGIDYNLAPVVDLNTNPKNPDIGAIGRSYSADPMVVRENVRVVNEVGRECGVGLCLKHYPGLGGATTNSHEALTDLSDTITEDQLSLFTELAPELFGCAVLISHGMVRQWDPRLPLSMSRLALKPLRNALPEGLLLSDDLQMNGLQCKLSTPEALIHGLRAQLDWLIVGNNLKDEQSQMSAFADKLAYELEADSGLASYHLASLTRIQRQKALFRRKPI
jgi:beta-N-acetylhexosaminidase